MAWVKYNGSCGCGKCGSHNIEIEIHRFMVFIFKHKYSH